MSNSAAIVKQVEKHWQALAAGDADRAHEVYALDAVLEFPQSGERFDGVTTFLEWRKQYPARVSYELRRMAVAENLAVVECRVSYNDGPWQYGVQILDFKDGLVSRERIYVTEAWEAPAWRAPWRSAEPSD